MLSVGRLAGLGALALVLLAIPALAVAAGMGGMGASAGTGGGASMMGNGMNNMMMGSYGTATGTAVVDPRHPDAPPDPSLRNFSHTGLRNPLHVSKAWQDLPVSDPNADGAPAPVPAAPSKPAK